MSYFSTSHVFRLTAVLTLSLIVGCPGLPDPDGDGNADEVVLSPETIVVAETQSMEVEEVGNDNLIYRDSGGGTAVEKGSILAGETSDGAYLRRVIETETLPDGRILVETEQASIEEAVTVGSASVSQKVFFDGGGTLVSGKVMPAGKALDTSGFSLVNNASVNAVIDNLAIDFNPDIDLDLRYNFGLKEFRVVVSGDLNIDLEASVNALGSINSRYEKEIAEIQGPIIIIPTPLLGIPVEVTPVLEIIGGVEVNASGSGSATCQSGLTLTTEAGVHFEEGDWSLIGNTSREFRSPQLVYEFDAGANVTVFVKVQVLFKFYHLAGPHIGVVGGLGVAAETALAPLGAIDWELYWSIAGSAGGSLEILTKKVLDISFELFEFQFVIDEGTIGGGPECGNGLCESGETNSSCPSDCQDAEPPDCGDGAITTMSATLPLPTYAFACAAGPTAGKIYCFGGGPGGATFYDEILEYDANADSLVTKTAVLPRGRFGLACAAHPATGRVYCFGGDAGPYLNQIVEYDPNTDTLVTKSAVLPSARTTMGCATDPAAGKIYCFGGNDGRVYYDQILEYDPITDTLATKSATLPSRRGGPACVASTVTGAIYCFGGRDESVLYDKIVEYAPATDTLVTKNAVLPAGRNYFSCVADAATGKIHCFGGYDGSTRFDEILEYDPATDTLVTKLATLPSRRTLLACAPDSGTGRIYCFGGNDEAGNPLDEIVEYDPPKCR